MSEHIYGQSSKGTRVASYPESRRCSEGGCSTILSIYNASDYCSLHGALIPRSRISPKWNRSR